jgi:hypothetical protein
MRVRSRTLIPRRGGSIPRACLVREESCRRMSAIQLDSGRASGSSRRCVGRMSARLLMATPTSTELTDLLRSTAYRLTYALPLLVVSTLLAFAGAFITLDRTRSFRPRRDPPHVPGSFNLTKRSSRVRFYLQGGLGGLAIGYSFGGMFICSLCRTCLRISQSICQRSWHWSFPMKRLLRH